MPAGNLEDNDLRYILTKLGVGVQDEVVRKKIEADLPAPATHSLKLEAINGGKEVLIVDAAAPVDFALCPTKDGGTATTPPLYEPKGQPVGAKIKGKPGYEWLDAKEQGGTAWWSKDHGRIKVEAEGSPTPPPPPPPPPPATTGYSAGACMGGWSRPQEVADAKKLAKNPCVRLENPTDVSQFKAENIGVIYLNSGGTSLNLPHLSDEARQHRSDIMLGLKKLSHDELDKYGYSTGGVKSLNQSQVVAAAVADVKKHGLTEKDVYEYLNEPGGDWFWGSGANSLANAEAYAHQSRAIAEAFVKEFGAHAPRVGVSMDGGHARDNSWGKNVMKADPTLFKHQLVWPTNHPYDGSGANPGSTLVGKPCLEETHALTGKWPLVTEYGRPLATGTGDSPKSTEAQQAAADGAMARFCKEKETWYTAYGYRGDGSPCYAIWKGDDTARPAVEAIAKA